MRYYVLGLIASFCLAIVGCDGVAMSNKSPIGIVDLDVVAQKLGRDQQILRLIEQRQIGLNEQLTATQKSLIDQLNQKKTEFGEITEDEVKQLAQLQNQANSILASTKSQAQSNLTTFQQEIVNRFRAEAKPIISELAAQRGCRLVLSKNDSVVFTFDTTIDLTDEVVARMQSKAPNEPPLKTDAAEIKTPVKQAATSANASHSR